jgi:hypothetical protein
MHWDTFNVQILKKLKISHVKMEFFGQKVAKNDQNWDILTFDPIFGVDIHRIGSN